MLDFVNTVSHLRLGVSNAQFVVESFLDGDEYIFVDGGSQNTSPFLHKKRGEICSAPKEADPQQYLPVYNKKFMVAPVSKEDLHRPVPQGIDLDKILCIRTVRTVRNDNTIAHDKKLYQSDESTMGKKVTVEERTDGKMLIVSQGRSLRYHQITARPEKIKQPVIRKTRKSRPVPHDHPWKKFFINKRKSPQKAVA